MATSPDPLAPAPAPRGARRLLRQLRRLLLSVLAALAAGLLGLAVLGAYFLTLRYEHPAPGRLLQVIADLPAGARRGEEAGERHSDYLHGERLGALRSRRPGNTLGSARRLGLRWLSEFELRDGQGQPVARGVGGAANAGTSALRVEVTDGDTDLVPRFTLTLEGGAEGGTRRSELLVLSPQGMLATRRLVEHRTLGGMLGTEARSGSELAALAASDREPRLAFATREDGVFDLFSAGGALSFLEAPPGLLTRMLGRDRTVLRFHFRIDSPWDLLPWTTLNGGYVVRDQQGELAAVRIEDFFLRYRDQTLYHYLVDLDGNGRLDAAIETIESVLVSHLPGAQEGRSTLEISFLAGSARIEDLEGFRLGDGVELLLPDAIAKGFGGDSDLGFIEEARDDLLALLEPAPANVASAISPIDPLRSAASYLQVVRAARRPYAEAMATALGERLPEPRFASREDLLALGAEPPMAPLSAAAPGPAGIATPAPGPIPVAGDLPPLGEPLARLVNHAEALLTETGASLWPGFGQAPPALLLVGAEVEWLIRHPRPPEGFLSQGLHPATGTEVMARKRSFDPSFQASFPVEGIPTVVMGTPEGTGLEAARWALTYVHEAFHCFQLQKGELDKTARLADLARGDTTGMWQLNYAFPYTDPAAGQALGLLGLALDRGAGALAGGLAGGVEPAGTTEPVRAALGAALALSALIQPEDLAYLRFVEWKEGVARHVELRAANLAAAAGMAPPSPVSAAPYADAAKQIEDGIRDALRSLGPGKLKRLSFYATGAGLARLLDARVPGWQERYFEPAITLEDLLEQGALAAAPMQPTPWLVAPPTSAPATPDVTTPSSPPPVSPPIPPSVSPSVSPAPSPPGAGPALLEASPSPPPSPPPSSH